MSRAWGSSRIPSLTKNPENSRTVPGGPGILLAAAFVALASWSWRKWTEPLLDFGGEAYIAWQLASGKALYRDIAWRDGPLGLTLCALWLKAFGASLSTLFAVNLAVAGAALAALHRLVSRAFGAAAAAVAGLAFLVLSVFAHGTYNANFNWVSPYSHCQPYALLLGAGLALLLGGSGRVSSTARAAAGGACLGLVFLTKMELFLAAAPAGAAGVALLSARSRVPWPRLAAFFAAGAAVAPLAFIGACAFEMPLDVAVRGALGHWANFTRVADNPYFLEVLGLDRPAENAFWLLVSSSILGAAAWGLASLDRAAASRRLPAGAAGAAGLAAFAALVAWPGLAPLGGLGRPLPVACAAACWLLWRSRLEAGAGRRDAFLIWSVFALGLLAKMFLNARLRHYGFALGAPAATVLAAASVGLLPELLERAKGGKLFRAVAAGLLLGLVANHLRSYGLAYAAKDFPIGEGGDRIVTYGPRLDPTGLAVRWLLGELRAHGRGRTLAVWPEGATVNFWARLENPTPFIKVNPVELAAFGGEAAALERVRAAPPDLIAVISRDRGDMAAYGGGHFGEPGAFGERLMAWVRESYEEVASAKLSQPGAAETLAVALWRRKGS